MFFKILNSLFCLFVITLLLLLPLLHLVVTVAPCSLFGEERLSRILHRQHLLQDHCLIQFIGSQAELVLL